MFIQSLLFISLNYVENFRFYLNLGIFEKGLGTLDFVKKFQFLDWAMSHLTSVCLCWPIVAILTCI